MNSYTELFSLVQKLAEDTSTEFLEYIPSAIALAEDRLYRLIDIDLSKEDNTKTTANNVRNITKPLDHRVTHNIFIEVNGERVRLINKTEDFVKDYWPSLNQTNIPKYYAEKDSFTWILAPTPDGVYNLGIEYEAQPVKISPANETNILTMRYPDLLLYATMSNVNEWMKDDERRGIWEDKLAEALASTNNEGVRQRHDDNTNVNNPIGGRNTKVKNGT